MAVSRPRAIERLPDSPDPVEIAMDLERGDDRPDSPARRLLVDQGRLIRTQIANERMGAALKVLTAVAGLLAVALLAAMAVQASRTEQLILQPFSVPPELERRGLTGEVVATRLRDALAGMQHNRISERAPSSYADDWSETPEIEIPQTGVSVSELQLAFRKWLGRETRISGEVVRFADGFQVTARAGGEPGETFSGTEAELDATIRRAAEAVYRMTQPDRYAGWLAEEGKRDDAAKLYQALSIRGTREARAWALAEWAGLERDPAIRLERARRAQALDPEHPVAAVHVAQSLKELGRSGEALDAYRRSASLLTGGRADELAPWWAALYAKEHRAEAEALLGDFAQAARLNDQASEPAPDQPPLACSNCSSYAALMAARDLARNHDAAGAARDAARAAEIFPEYAPVMRAYPPLLSAQAAEDWPVVDRLITAARADPRLAALYVQSLGLGAMQAAKAEALARTGRVAEARAYLAATAPTCVPCLRARGTVEALAGAPRASDAWFARAVRAAPALPAAHHDWGRAALARGEFAGALERFERAGRLGRRWADPLKGQGDALARLGRHEDAVRRYRQAAERAPHWGALHLAWGRSLLALGRREEAQARLAQAARLHLSDANRAALTRVFAPPPPARRLALGAGA